MFLQFIPSLTWCREGYCVQAVMLLWDAKHNWLNCWQMGSLCDTGMLCNGSGHELREPLFFLPSPYPEDLNCCERTVYYEMRKEDWGLSLISPCLLWCDVYEITLRGRRTELMNFAHSKHNSQFCGQWGWLAFKLRHVKKLIVLCYNS